MAEVVEQAASSRTKALILDNFPGHKVPMDEVAAKIRTIFLPPNTTSYLQLCNQGIISYVLQ